MTGTDAFSLDTSRASLQIVICLAVLQRTHRSSVPTGVVVLTGTDAFSLDTSRASLQIVTCLAVLRRRHRSCVPTGVVVLTGTDAFSLDTSRASARLYSSLRFSSGCRGLHSVVLELLGIEATYLSLALVHLPTGVLYIYVCGVLVEVGTLLRCDE